MATPRTTLDRETTRVRLLDAAVATVVEDGIAGTSARVVGARAGVNASLIYYHFGNLDDLLAEASRMVSVARAAVYRDRLAAVTSLSELANAARDLRDEDRAAGNVVMLSQLLAGVKSHPALAPAVRENFELLTREVTTTIDRLLSGTVLDGVLDSGMLARSVAAAFLGGELLETVAQDGDPELLDGLDAVARLVDTILQAGTLSSAVLRRRITPRR